MCNPDRRSLSCPSCNAAWLGRLLDVPAREPEFELGLEESKHRFYLQKTKAYANSVSDCAKVKVGALVRDIHSRTHYGANKTMPGICSGRESCEVDGHCISTIHAEIDAIVRAKCNLYNGTIYVTRYPCESCAKAIVAAGISKVVYSGEQPISEATRNILEAFNVEIHHIV